MKGAEKMEGGSEYIMPRNCERCESSNLAVRVIKEHEIVRYMCLDCGYSRSLPKEENLKMRINTSVNNWARQVVKRHPFCEICGSKDGLEAHHIIPVSNDPFYAYTPTNGITLCKKCHWAAHHKVTASKEANGDD